MVVTKSLCIHCGEGAKACPVDAVFLDPMGEPYLCPHCGRCVSFCPNDCLELMDLGAAGAEDGDVQERAS